MNIFAIDSNPYQAARWMVDKHIVKMVLETAQLLSTTHRVLDGTKINKSYVMSDDKVEKLFYKSTHINHPSSIWVRETRENYYWLMLHLDGLLCEYTNRYGKQHKVYRSGIFHYMWDNKPVNIPAGSLTPFKLAMPDQYKISDDPIECYREYYRKGKTELHSWKFPERKPYWIIR